LNDQIKDGEVGRACEMYVRGEMCLQGLVGQPEEKRPLGRPGQKLKNTACKTVVKEM